MNGKHHKKVNENFIEKKTNENFIEKNEWETS